MQMYCMFWTKGTCWFIDIIQEGGTCEKTIAQVGICIWTTSTREMKRLSDFKVISHEELIVYEGYSLLFHSTPGTEQMCVIQCVLFAHNDIVALSLGYIFLTWPCFLWHYKWPNINVRKRNCLCF